MQATLNPPVSRSRIEFPALVMLKEERVLIGTHIILALVFLSIGILLGPFQTWHRSPSFIAAFPDAQIPIFSYYYQALTVHGAMNALFFTTFFIVGLSYFVTQRSLQRSLISTPLAWVAFGLMLTGVVLIAGTVILDQVGAAVLFTFYAPMIAPPFFYLGVALFVIGSWVAGIVVFFTYDEWRADNPGVRAPLAVYATVANFVLWVLCSIPAAVEVLFMLLPASLGVLTTVDPQFGRALFWFMGHPLVYFWLLPAYLSWYTMLPKQAGGRLFSDPLARVAFLLLLIFALPTGVHHLFEDPGITETTKWIHWFFTFLVAFPSFLTAFNIGSSLEIASRNNGGKTFVHFFTKQRWSDPVVAAQLVGMLQFVSGGITGIINASDLMNQLVHNTSWIPGHFHQTVGGAVTMTYLGIMYWMLPMIRGRQLFSRKIALWQIGTWFVGMITFGLSMGEAGLAGAPRRTLLGFAPYLNDTAKMWLDVTAISGVILMISSILLITNIVGTLFFSRKPFEYEVPIQTAGPKHAPLILEKWKLWIAVTLALILIAWIPAFVDTVDFNNGWNALRYSPASPVPMR